MSSGVLLKLAQKFNCFYLTGKGGPKKGRLMDAPLGFAGFQAAECKPFVVEGCQVGLIRPDVMRQLTNYPEVSMQGRSPP